MWQLHHSCSEVTRDGLRPGWNCRHGNLFTQRPGWNKTPCTFYYYPRLSDHHHGRDQVQNCPIGQPSLEKWGFLMDLFVLGHRARLKLGEIRSILETLPMVQISSNFGKLTIFRFPTIEHNIRFQLYLVKFCLCLLTPGT